MTAGEGKAFCQKERKKKKRKYKQRASEDVAFIRELTYTLPINLEEGLEQEHVAVWKCGTARVKLHCSNDILSFEYFTTQIIEWLFVVWHHNHYEIIELSFNYVSKFAALRAVL